MAIAVRVTTHGCSGGRAHVTLLNKENHAEFSAHVTVDLAFTLRPGAIFDMGHEFDATCEGNYLIVNEAAIANIPLRTAHDGQATSYRFAVV